MSVKRHKGSFSVDEEYVDELAGHSRFKEVSSNEFKHVISSLEKAILKNQDYRMKFAGNPNKYVGWGTDVVLGDFTILF